MSLQPLIRPPALQEGDCIGLAAPASPFDRQALQVGESVRYLIPDAVNDYIRREQLYGG